MSATAFPVKLLSGLKIAPRQVAARGDAGDCHLVSDAAHLGEVSFDLSYYIRLNIRLSRKNFGGEDSFDLRIVFVEEPSPLLTIIL